MIKNFRTADSFLNEVPSPSPLQPPIKGDGTHVDTILCVYCNWREILSSYAGRRRGGMWRDELARRKADGADFAGVAVALFKDSL